MSKECGAFIVGGIGGFVAGCLFVLFADLAAVEKVKKQAIDHGFAEHDSKTGKWQWKAIEQEAAQ